MNRKNLSILICIFIISFSSVVFANEGVYFGLQGGVTFLNDSTIKEAGFVPVDLAYGTGFVINGALGYDFGMFRLEGEVGYRDNDLDKFSHSFSSESVDGNLDAWSFMCNGFWDIENQTPFTPYLVGGIGFAKVSLDILDGPHNGASKDNDTVFAYQLGVGVGYDINNSWTLDLAYRYFATEDAELIDDCSGLPYELEYESHNIFFGVRYNF